MAPALRFPNQWHVGEWTFYEIEGHGFTSYKGKPLFGWSSTDVSNGPTSEYFPSLDRAIIAAIGEKYTGPRRAGGTGFGTAADWFAKMIGMDDLVAVDQLAGRRALQDVIVATRQHDGPIYRRANAMQEELEKRGLVLATLNDHAHKY